MEYTKEQKQAIDTLDKSILVAAAAGSGKTAVLIQRIVNIILQGEADVDEMLVVTFTNAAAAEMRLKLAKAIRKKMQENPESRELLSAQLDKLYRAYISTIDSFAIRIIKEFFYELDMEPNFRICDDVQGTMMKFRAVDELFEACFVKDDYVAGGSFREFLRLYSSDRSERSIKESIVRDYDKLRSMPDYFEWANSKAEQMRVSIEDFRGSELEQSIVKSCREIMQQIVETLRECRNLFIGADLSDMYEEKLFADELEQAERIAAMLEGGHLDKDVTDALLGFEFVVIRGSVKAKYKDAYNDIKLDLKLLRDPVKEKLKAWKSGYLSPSVEQRIEEQNEAYKYTKYYINLLEAFESFFSALKKEQGMMDFADTEHTAARILKNNDIADTLRKRFKYIFVDEYQDTNNIQESLIGRFSRPDNVFKVGDVKQSIYRFRQAEPAIFQRIYKSYGDEANTDAITIDLNRNFRCNPRTVAYINDIFADLMDGYDEAAALHPGIDFCPEEYDFIPETHLLLEESKSDEAEDEDEELRELSNTEAEAEYVAGLIAKLIGTDFYDTVTREVRKVCARDIVVLLRGIKYRGEIYAKAIRSIDVQTHVEEDADYFDTVEIKVALSMLMSIDNLKRDVPLIATLRSEAFGFGVDELSIIRAEHKSALRAEGLSKRDVPFWEALEWYTESGSNEELRDRIKAARAQLEEWKELASMMPLEDFVWKVLTDSNYYLYAGAMADGGRRQANLRTLVDRASDYAKDAIVSLGDFIKYVEVLQSKKLSSAQASLVGKDDDVVRIQTIHKSKGLEYPFVIVAGLGSHLKNDPPSKSLMFDADLGVSLSYVQPDKRFWRMTILQQMIHDKQKRDGIEEEKRVLYVALTRARNKLILVGTGKEKNKETLLKTVNGEGPFYTMIGRKLSTPFNRFIVRPLVKTGEWEHRSRADKLIEKCLPAEDDEIYKSETYAEVARRLEYRYPSDKLGLKAKYSVSELRREKLNEIDMDEAGSDDEVVAIVRNVNNQKKRAKSSDIGIAYHRIMEYLDFGKVIGEDGAVDGAYIRESANQLLDQSAIDADVFSDINIGKIEAFFEQDLGQRAVRASRKGLLRKEKPFTLVRQKDGNPVLVQGVIDCCFEEDGELVLIDYKSSFIRKGQAHEQELERIRREYAVQIEIYREAVEQGLGKKVKESYLYLFLTSESLAM